MTDDELGQLCWGGVTFALDSNVVFGQGLLDLADQVNKLIESGHGLALVIPALVHGEHLVQEQGRWGPQFKLTKALSTLEQKNVAVVAYEPSDAEGFAAWIHAQFPDPQDWRRARWERLFGSSSGERATRCPATVDWHIAAQAEVRQWVCVTDDTGSEFAKLQRKCSSEQLRRVLQKLEEARGS